MPFYNMYYKYLVSAECVCKVSAQNTPQIIYYIILKMAILSGSRNTQIFVPVSLTPKELLLPPLFQNRAAPFQLIMVKNMFWF